MIIITAYQHALAIFIAVLVVCGLFMAWEWIIDENDKINKDKDL